MMHIAFTGTLRGMTSEQDMALIVLYAELQVEADFETTAHHGDAIGSDDRFHTIAYRAGSLLELHPCKQGPVNKRAYAADRLSTPSTFVHPPLGPLTRNQIMVEAAKVLIATPRQMSEPAGRRSGGTWHTIRVARKLKVPRYIIWPDGRVEKEDRDE